jgi:hypothetical protein
MTTVTANQKMYFTRMYFPVTGYERREVVPKRHPALVTYSVPSVLSPEKGLDPGPVVISSHHSGSLFGAICDAAFELCTVQPGQPSSFVIERIDRDMRYLGQGRFSYENTRG